MGPAAGWRAEHSSPGWSTADEARAELKFAANMARMRRYAVAASSQVNTANTTSFAQSSGADTDTDPRRTTERAPAVPVICAAAVRNLGDGTPRKCTYLAAMRLHPAASARRRQQPTRSGPRCDCRTAVSQRQRVTHHPAARKPSGEGADQVERVHLHLFAAFALCERTASGAGQVQVERFSV